MNNNPENPEGELFQWAQKHASQETPEKTEIKYASPDDGLGWGDTREEIGYRQSTKLPDKKVVPIQGHDPKPSDEIPVEEALEELNRIHQELFGDKEAS